MAKYQEFRIRMRNKEKLQELILKESIKTVFQPIVDLIKNEVIGYEALTRGPEGTEYQNPYLLFDVADETELLFELDRLCRKKAIRTRQVLKSTINCF
jgi:EAL domain-containing protein (putative c-di-GMP-specific phosphodiesterase class I)